jgi:hypothetical protein
LRLDFDRRVMLQFRGSVVTSDAGLLACRELDDALGLSVLAGDALADGRTGNNGRHALAPRGRGNSRLSDGTLIRQVPHSRLFEGRERVGDETRLPLKVYESLGGLKGIVNEAGKTALASLGDGEKARLPRLLRQLAVPAHDQDGIGKGAPTIRAVPLAQAAPEEAARKLLDALVTARLLTVSGIEADAQVRLTHQRVLENWARAGAIVAESADFYRIRADLEESRRKWEAGKRRNELLLARGLPLAEAESIIGKYGDESWRPRRSPMSGLHASAPIGRK